MKEEAIRSHQKRYLIEVWPAIGLYVAALFASSFLAPQAAGSAVWQRVLIALLPLPAIVWMMAALLRRLLRKDELEQRIELMAIAVASASVGIVSLAWGLLDLNGLVARVSLFYVLPALMGVYGLVKCVTWARYR
jgi:hypothetical protein